MQEERKGRDALHSSVIEDGRATNKQTNKEKRGNLPSFFRTSEPTHAPFRSVISQTLCVPLSHLTQSNLTLHSSTAHTSLLAPRISSPTSHLFCSCLTPSLTIWFLVPCFPSFFSFSPFSILFFSFLLLLLFIHSFDRTLYLSSFIPFTLPLRRKPSLNAHSFSSLPSVRPSLHPAYHCIDALYRLL